MIRDSKATTDTPHALDWLDNWYDDCIARRVCPQCPGDLPLAFDGDANGLECPACGFFDTLTPMPVKV